MRLYYWIEHTGVYDGNSGVQRVVRSLATALLQAGVTLVPVRWCAEREAIIHAEPAWLDRLADYGGPRLNGHAEPGQAIHLAAGKEDLADAWFLLGEVPHVAGAGSPPVPLILDYARYYRMRVAAIFYDLVPLRIPGYEAMAPAHAGYADAIAAAAVLFPISRHSGEDLLRWWDERGIDARRSAAVRPLLLPAEQVGVARRTDSPPARGDGEIRLVLLGSVEPRKNQLAVLRAAGRLHAAGRTPRIRLDIVGHLHGAVAVAVREEAARNPDVHLHGYLPDDQVVALVERADATVFMSLEEGFGLPVAESLWLGRPSLCSGFGSMAEIAEGGGCLQVDSRSGAAIERALERFATDPALRERLAEEAVSRALSTWADYAGKLLAELAALPRLSRLVELAGSRPSVVPFAPPPRVVVRRLAWREDSRALLPADTTPRAGGPGDFVTGLWSVLPLSTLADDTAVLDVVEVAHSLGLRVALRADRPLEPDELSESLIARCDLVLFATEDARDALLAHALLRFSRTLGVRAKYAVAADDAAVLRVLGEQDEPLSRPSYAHPPRRIFYWCALTAAQDFNTGIQRVSRGLAAGLQARGVEVIPVGWDVARNRMRVLSEEEWTRFCRWGGPRALPLPALPPDLSGEWLLVPEITIPVMPHGSNTAEHARSLGMRVAAVFHDLIPIKQPEHYSAGALRNVKAYLRTFGSVDVALPVSWTVAGDLGRYLTGVGLPVPRIVPCPNPGELGTTPRVTEPRPRRDRGRLRVLAVGTLEPRKNYGVLLAGLGAARRLASVPIELTIVGRRAEYDAVAATVDRQATDDPLFRLFTDADDEQLVALYGEHDLSVYASFEEGFGLPVLESIWRGLPCLCHDGSALAEVAPGGGTITTDMRDPEAIGTVLAALADDPDRLACLAEEAIARPLRSWADHAGQVLAALAHTAAAPGWPLPAIVTNPPCPLLSCVITTYNRAGWLAHSLPRLLEATRPWRDAVEVVVCDNASGDATPNVVARHAREPGFRALRNAANVGMLGNLGASARAAHGAFVWVLGDDDLIIDGAVENVLEGIARHPEIEMAYCNYSYTHIDAPGPLANVKGLLRTARPISPAGENRYAARLRDVAASNENLFTSIYACIFRRDHALRAYQQDVEGAPFSSLLTCVPSSVYALTCLLDRPAWWIGEPAVVVNMNVSWLRWALLWHLERMPDLYEMAEVHGVPGGQMERYRAGHCVDAASWFATVYERGEDAVRLRVSMRRFLERTKHLPIVRDVQLERIKAAYCEAWKAGRVVADTLPPDELFRCFGLEA